MSSKDTSGIYHKSKLAVNQETCLKEYIDKRLLPFIAKYHSNGNYLSRPDLVKSALLKYCSRTLDRKNLPFIPHVDNLPNVPLAHAIETVWTVLERKIYENN